MASTPIDSNSVAVAFAVTDDANQTPSGLRADVSTGYLMIEVVEIVTEEATSRDIKIDENSVSVAFAVTDDANEDLSPLLADTDNLLLVDLFIEE